MVWIPQDEHEKSVKDDFWEGFRCEWLSLPGQFVNICKRKENGGENDEGCFIISDILLFRRQRPKGTNWQAKWFDKKGARVASFVDLDFQPSLPMTSNGLPYQNVLRLIDKHLLDSEEMDQALREFYS